MEPQTQQRDYREELRQKDKSLNTWIAVGVVLGAALISLLAVLFLIDGLMPF